MGKKYAIKNLLKMYEEDSYKEGCLPKTGGCISVDVSFEADTAKELIKKVCAFVNGAFEGSEKCWEVNPCEDEPSRVDFQVMETDESYEPTKAQYSEWKKGKFRLWTSTYTAKVELVQREKVNLAEVLHV